MANPRKPVAVATVTGATISHPARHRDRSDPPVAEIGEPYDRMTDEEKAIWAESVSEFPWLAASDRRQLKLLCQLVAGWDAQGAEYPFRRLNMIRQILNSFGGSPSDRSRVAFRAATPPGAESEFIN